MKHDGAELSALQKAYLKLEELRARLEISERARREPIAIIGAGCRLPGGVRNLDDYWELLVEGRDVVSEVPPERWSLDEFYDPDPSAPGKMYTRWGSFITDVDQFDAAFFGISPREAVSMDPQQRLLLEVAWEALENAAIAPDSLAGSNTGVFVGIGFNDYARLIAAQDVAQVSAYSGSGVQLCFAAGRVSYSLGLRGPSLAIDTACSSSLVALHQACQSLRAGECDLALSGGVNLILAPEGNVFLSKAGALSRTGRCRTFDASADGMVRGDGCGVIVLKRLRDAVSDGDHVLAVIRGSAANHDGRSSGLTVPSGPAQEAVMRQALKNADVRAHQLSYVEAHGTGTPLGDPIELQSTAAVYGERPNPAQPLLIASVKTNFGHLEAASGITSVLKVALMLQKRSIPKHLHFQQYNPHISLNGAAITVPTEFKPWRVAGEERRLAAVSSFGLSGTNVHLILEEHTASSSAEASPSSAGTALPETALVLPLSAKKPAALVALAKAYGALLEASDAPRLLDVCRTAAVGRSHHDFRAAVVAASSGDMAAQLRAFAEQRETVGVASGRRPLDKPTEIVFVFTGQGPQYAGMARDLWEREPEFRRVLEHCEGLIEAELGWSLTRELFADDVSSRLDQTEVAQPCLFAFQVALAALWQNWGIEPAAVIGHSLGEIAAAHVSGALTLPDAVRLVCRRGRVMQRVTGCGRMAAVGLSPDEAAEVLRGVEDLLAIAAINGPRSIVLSGDEVALKRVVSKLEARGTFCRMLPVNYAFHSPQTAALASDLLRALGVVTAMPSVVPMISTVTGAVMPGERLNAEYWAKNMTSCVRFEAGVRSALAAGRATFVELGPHPALITSLRDIAQQEQQSASVVPSLRRDAPARETLLKAAAELYARGCTIHWQRVYPGKKSHVRLPTYPWQRQRFWIETRSGSATFGAAASPQPSAAAKSAGADPVAVQEWLYELKWVGRDAAPAQIYAPGTWIVFGDASGVGAELVHELESAGQRCRVVSADRLLPALRELRDDTSGDPFRTVLDELTRGLDAPVRGVIHLWALDAAPVDAASPGTVLSDQYLGARSAVALIQALQARAGNKPRLWLVTRGSQAVSGRAGAVACSQAPLWAIGRTCAAEHPDLWGGLVDLDPEASASSSAKNLFEAVSAADGEDQVAYANGRRYVARLARVSGEPAQPVSIDAAANYVITGGLDGLGLEVAHWLVQRGARHLVLVGRTPLPPRERWDSADHPAPVSRRMSAIRALEAAGASVWHPAVDVTSEQQMEALSRALVAAGRRVGGVVHAASIWRDTDGRGVVGPLAVTTASSFDIVLPAKVAGSLLLRKLCAAAQPDFVVFFSSGAALVGSAGQANYAAANAFMDSLAHELSRSGTRALSVNWGPIGDVGFGTSSEGRAVFELWRRRGISPISAQQMLASLERLLASEQRQAGVMNIDWDTLAGAYAEMLQAPWASELVLTRRGVQREDFPQTLARTPTGERFDKLAEHIQKQVVHVMGLSVNDAPELDQGLFDMGMDSLLALDLKNRLQSSLRQEVPAAALFEHSTIASLAEYLLRDVLDLPGPDKPATTMKDPQDLINNISELSEAEVERLLAQRLAGGMS